MLSHFGLPILTPHIQEFKKLDNAIKKRKKLNHDEYSHQSIELSRVGNYNTNQYKIFKQTIGSVTKI